MNLSMLKTAMLSVLLAGTFQSNAQKMITFESHEVHAHSRTASSDGKNSVTMGIVSWINGYTPVYYERAVAGILSIQAGAGFTSRSYMNDLGMAIWNDGNQNSDRFNGSDDIEDHYEYYKFRKATIGTYFSIAPKIYFGEDNLMNGVYVAPMLEYKSYRYRAQLADITQPAADYYSSYDDDRTIPHVKDEVKEHMNCMDLTIHVGGHYQSRSHLAIGWSIGFGARHSSSERLDIGKVADSNGDYYYANNIVSYSKTKPLFTFNFTMGGWF